MTTDELDDLATTVATLRAWADTWPPGPVDEVRMHQVARLATASSSAVVVRLISDLLGHPMLIVRRAAVAVCGPHLDNPELRRRLALLAWWDPTHTAREDARQVLAEHGYELGNLRSLAGL